MSCCFLAGSFSRFDLSWYIDFQASSFYERLNSGHGQTRNDTKDVCIIQCLFVAFLFYVSLNVIQRREEKQTFLLDFARFTIL